MRVLFDIVHPGHVHLFKNLIKYFINNDYLVVIVSRNKDFTNYLLEYYNIDYKSLTTAQSGLIGLLKEITVRDLKIFQLNKKYNFDIGLGTSASIAHLSTISSMKSYIFEEDDDDVIQLWANITYPFATKIIVPSCLKYNKWKKKRVIHKSYHELAYLHPNNFTPSKDICNYLDIGKDETFSIIRLSALKAHHDFGVTGLTKSMLKKIINLLKQKGHIFITSEGNIHPEFKEYKIKIPAHKIHDALYYATMYIGDSQTMAAEAAVLGTPSIRNNSFVGRISYLEELEHRYKLTYGFRPGQEKLMVQKIEELLTLEDLDKTWQKRRKKMLEEKDDFNRWIIDFFQAKYRDE